MSDPPQNPGYLDQAVLHNLTAFTKALKRRITDLLKIKPGDHAIDVGCGTGSDLIAMARMVGETGLVVGLDYDPAMTAEAAALARQAGVVARVLNVTADAQEIPHSACSFDACRCERLLQHVEDPERVVKDMVRIIRKGGRIVVADTDWATLSIDAPDFAIERRIARFRAEMYYNGCAGRQIFRLMKRQRLQVSALEVHPIVWTDYGTFRATSFALNNFEQRLIDSRTITENELAAFLDYLAEADRQGTFYASGNIVVVAGLKQA